MTRSNVQLPLYTRIMAVLRSQIESGSLTPGDRAPSERELAEVYGVSRMTARRALSELAQEGVLTRVQGQGTFVSNEKIEHSVSELVGFSQDMRRRGLQPQTTTLSVQRQLPSLDLAARLHIQPGEDVVRLERLRSAAGKPMSHEVSVIPGAFVPGIERMHLDGSLYELLQDEFDIRLTKAQQRIEGLKADQRQARLLDIGEGDVLLRLERISFADDRIVEFVRAHYRADRYVFLSSLESKRVPTEQTSSMGGSERTSPTAR